MLLWLFYNVKCIFFGNKTLNKSENSFLVNLQLFSFRKQAVIFFINHLLLYLPVLVYSFFVVAMSFKNKHTGIAFLLIVYQLINCIIGGFLYYFSLNSSFKKNNMKFSYLQSKVNAISSISYPFYLLTYTAFQRKITFLSIKLFSLFILYILFVLNKNDFNYINFIIVFLTLVMAHAILPFYYISFFEKQISFYRNLPVSRLKIAFIYFITYCVVLIPELLFLLTNAHDHISFSDIFLLYTIAVVNLLLFTSILYTEDIRMKKYYKIIFVVFFISVFLLNLKNYILLIGAELLITAIVFISNYHRYETKQSL